MAGLLFATAAEPVALQDRMQLADGLFRRSLFDLAAKEYAALAQVENVEGMDNILFRLAECLRRTQKMDQAEKVYLKLIADHPKSPHIPRARLQCALLQMDFKNEESYKKAIQTLEPLAHEGIAPEVRSAALYHLAQAFEQLKEHREALAHYEVLRKRFPNTDYALYAGIKSAWLMAETGNAEARAQAMELYKTLAEQKKDPKIAEEALYFAAKLAFKEKRYEQSATLYQTLQKQFPDSPRLAAGTLSAAWANYHAGHYQQASDLLAGALKQTDLPDRANALYLKANCLRQLDDTDGAAAAYAQLQKEFPDGELSVQAWYEYLTLLYKAGKYEETIAVSGQRIPPPDQYLDEVLWMTAEAALACNKHDTVVQNCKMLVTRCPKSPFVKDALYRLGWLLNKQKAWDEAANWFLEIVKQFPQDPMASKALYSAGVCHAYMGKRDVALRDWTDLLTRYPEAPEAEETLYQKAMEELRSKDYRAAGATLDERFRRFPDAPKKADTLYWRAAIYRQVKDYPEAEKTYRACLAANPSKEIEREAILELGIILLQLNREAEAAETLCTLLDSPVAEKMGEDRLTWLSTFEFSQKRYDAAAKAARILISVKPDKGWLQTGWTLLGRVHRAKNERDAAIHAFEEAMKTGASTEFAPEAALRLGELLSDAGRFDDAAHYLDEAAKRASSPDKIGLRAHAYMGLARNAAKKGSDEDALRYYISVGILFDDPVLVPEALTQSAELLEKLGRPAEAKAMRDELKTRYPDKAGTDNQPPPAASSVPSIPSVPFPSSLTAQHSTLNPQPFNHLTTVPPNHLTILAGGRA